MLDKRKGNINFKRISYLYCFIFLNIALILFMLNLIGCATISKEQRYYENLRKENYGILALLCYHPGWVKTSAKNVSLINWDYVTIKLTPLTNYIKRLWSPPIISIGYNYLIVPLPPGNYTLHLVEFVDQIGEGYLWWSFPLKQDFYIAPYTITYIGSLYFRETHEWKRNLLGVKRKCPFEIIVKDESGILDKLLDYKIRNCQCLPPQQQNDNWKNVSIGDWVLYDLNELRKQGKFDEVKISLIAQQNMPLTGILTVQEYQPSYYDSTYIYHLNDYQKYNWLFNTPRYHK